MACRFVTPSHVLLSALIAGVGLPAWCDTDPAKPPPRLQSPAEVRNSSTAPGDLRPERPVTPQVSVPLRKPGQTNDAAAARAAALPTRTAVDEDDLSYDPEAELKHCATLKGEQVRAKCKDKVASRDRRPPPR